MRVTDRLAWNRLRELIEARTHEYAPGGFLEFRDMAYPLDGVWERRINVHVAFGVFSVRLFMKGEAAVVVYCDGKESSMKVDLESLQPNKSLFKFDSPGSAGHNCYGDPLEALMCLWLKRVLVESSVYTLLPEGVRAQYIEHTGVVLVFMPKKRQWGLGEAMMMFTVFLFDKDPHKFVKLGGSSGPNVVCGTVNALIEAIETRAV